ncbi:hypothetical protein [Hymenobacter perfusus]|uniref:Uncharacterized protein n=1 Tax=Hymenobacter perfusus TaxID=1236770 RepID=A0A428K9W8_9BACT|nr:hypothetical protein [Hymenobacter perfusus]RSK43266.1 hypothetical protein EI293_10160 [Hymenobacter perfusus]
MLSSAASAQLLQPLTTLEPVAEFGRCRPIGVAVLKQSRILVTFPKKPKDYDYELAARVEEIGEVGI